MAHRFDLLIFANPISGMGRGIALAQQLTQAARAAHHRVHLYERHPQGAPDAIFSPQSVIVAIGGDGTLRSVADRLLAATPAARPLAPIVTIPLGTANLVATHLGGKWRHDQIGTQVLHAIQHGRRRHLDVARANGQAMLAIGGVGFDAQVVHDLAARRRGPISYADYLLPTLRSITGYRFPPLNVVVDGQTALEDTPAIAFVGNIPEYGAGFSVTPTARSDDRLLDVCILPCKSWRELFELGFICATGQQPNHERAIYRRGRHVKITSLQQVPVQIDGDAGGFTPATFDLLDRQLTFILPSA